MRVPIWLAIPVIVLVALNPSFIGYEHWAFYTMLEAFFLAGGAVAVTAWEGAPLRRAKRLACAYSAAVSGTRALFHPVWAAALSDGVLLCRARSPWPVTRAEAAWALLPVALGLGVMAKNATVAGHFATTPGSG
jgi:hypothetical protein